MKLYCTPGTCSLGIHVLLEEIGKPYELETLALAKGEQNKPEFTAVNPKSKVPTLVRDDGSVLTEFPAIAYYLVASNPEAKLMPETIDGQARMLETMDYVVASVHMQAFSRVFRPSAYTDRESEYDAVKAAGFAMVDKCFAILDKQLAGKSYVTGSMSAADAALFYTEFWYAKRMGKTLPPNLATHFATMTSRPAVAKVLADEGFGG
jgi:glutathione S-transferase